MVTDLKNAPRSDLEEEIEKEEREFMDSRN
jgi:hypothetical protein